MRNLLEISTRPRISKDKGVVGLFSLLNRRGIYDDKDDHRLVRTVDHVCIAMFVALIRRSESATQLPHASYVKQKQSKTTHPDYSINYQIDLTQ
jgi:hypothetical protein